MSDDAKNNAFLKFDHEDDGRCIVEVTDVSGALAYGETWDEAARGALTIAAATLRAELAASREQTAAVERQLKEARSRLRSDLASLELARYQRDVFMKRSESLKARAEAAERERDAAIASLEMTSGDSARDVVKLRAALMGAEGERDEARAGLKLQLKEIELQREGRRVEVAALDYTRSQLAAAEREVTKLGRALMAKGADTTLEREVTKLREALGAIERFIDVDEDEPVCAWCGTGKSAHRDVDCPATIARTALSSPTTPAGERMLCMDQLSHHGKLPKGDAPAREVKQVEGVSLECWDGHTLTVSVCVGGEDREIMRHHIQQSGGVISHWAGFLAWSDDRFAVKPAPIEAPAGEEKPLRRCVTPDCDNLPRFCSLACATETEGKPIEAPGKGEYEAKLAAAGETTGHMFSPLCLCEKCQREVDARLVHAASTAPTIPTSEKP
jgi:hypothetical protein